jgi:fatty-acyl-CoA synthase
MLSDAATPAVHPSSRWRSITDRLVAVSGTRPDDPAVSFPDRQLTYAELDGATEGSASWLLRNGVARGDRVGLLFSQASAAYVIYAAGIQRIGAICVPVNARNKSRELSYVVRHSEMRMLLTDSDFADVVEAAALPKACAVVDLTSARPDLTADAGTVAAAEALIARDDPALMLYTSGTTANPKGCLHSHGTLLAEGENNALHLQITSQDRFWTPLPMFHVGGWQVLMATLARGACFSHAGRFDATATLTQLETERVTIAFPAFELIWNGVLGHPRFPAADLSALRVIINTGAPERLQQMQAAMPHARQISCFGSTESCGSICLGDPVRDSLESRTTSSGRPLRGVEIRIVDTETGETCEPGVPGEMHFRGPTRFIGYWNDPTTTRESVDADGWFRTGDLMRWNHDGTVSFVSRLKDMLKVGGENVSPAEIEGFLVTHPAVTVASVVGAPDDRYGQVAAAYVQLAPGSDLSEDEMIAFCVGKIATYKVPRYLRVVDSFPVTATQKIQKFVLSERIAAELLEQGITEAPKLQSERRPQR